MTQEAQKKYTWKNMKSKGYKLFDKKLMKNILKICIPIVIANAIFAITSITDNLSLGWWAPKDALSAAGLSERLYWIGMLFVMIVPSLYGFLFAQFLGSKKYKQMKDTYKSALLYSTILSFVFMLVILFAGRPIIALFLGKNAAHSKAIIDMAYKYTRILVGIIILEGFLQTTIEAMIAEGKQRQLMCILISGIIMNLPLNYLLMKHAHLGYLGCAYSTLISWLFSSIILFAYVWYAHRKKQIHFVFKIRTLFKIDRHIDKMAWKRILGGLSSVFVEITIVLTMTVLSRQYGPSGIAILAMISPFFNLLLFASSGILSSKSYLVGRKLGADEFEEAYANDVRINLYAFILSIFNMILIIGLAYPIPLMYSTQNKAEQIQATYCMMAIGVSYVFVIVCSSFASSLSVGGKSIQKFLATSIQPLILEVIVFWVISLYWTPDFWMMYVVYRAFKSTKFIVAYLFWRKKSWLTNVSKEHPGEGETLLENMEIKEPS